MENQENKEEKKTCSCKQDAKTFLIAFLTAVIVVAVYHFGCGLYRIYCAGSCNDEIPVCQNYMLVPVRALPPCGPGEHGMDSPHPRHHNAFRNKRKMERKGMERRGMEPPQDEHPAPPQKPVAGEK